METAKNWVLFPTRDVGQSAACTKDAKLEITHIEKEKEKNKLNVFHSRNAIDHFQVSSYR